VFGWWSGVRNNGRTPNENDQNELQIVDFLILTRVVEGEGGGGGEDTHFLGCQIVSQEEHMGKEKPKTRVAPKKNGTLGVSE